MHTALQLLFIGISLWVIYGAIRYSGPAQIEVLGVFASDGTRLDRPYHQAVLRQPAFPSRISVSGRVHLAMSDSGRLVITGPGRVTING